MYGGCFAATRLKWGYKVTECYVPTFSINASADWKLDYAREGRIDIAQRAARKIAMTVAEYEEESNLGSCL